MNFFGWLMSCCVNDEPGKVSREALSTALVFASGMAASGITLYLVAAFHLI